jgi:hypothetical protein
MKRSYVTRSKRVNNAGTTPGAANRSILRRNGRERDVRDARPDHDGGRGAALEGRGVKVHTTGVGA